MSTLYFCQLFLYFELLGSAHPFILKQIDSNFNFQFIEVFCINF